MNNETNKIIPFPTKESLTLNLTDIVADAARSMAAQINGPFYLVHIDNDHVDVCSVFTDQLTFKRKREVARAVSAAIKAI